MDVVPGAPAVRRQHDPCRSIRVWIAPGNRHPQSRVRKVNSSGRPTGEKPPMAATVARHEEPFVATDVGPAAAGDYPRGATSAGARNCHVPIGREDDSARPPAVDRQRDSAARAASPTRVQSDQTDLVGPEGDRVRSARGSAAARPAVGGRCQQDEPDDEHGCRAHVGSSADRARAHCRAGANSCRAVLPQ